MNYYNYIKIRNFFLYLLFFLLPLVFSPVNFFLFEIPKTTFISLIAFFLATLQIIIVSKEKQDRRYNSDLFLALFFIITLLIALNMLIVGNGLKSNFFSSAIPILFIGYIFSTLKFSTQKKLLFTGIYSLFIVSVYGIIQRLGIDFPIWGGNIGKKVVFSTIGNPNTAAEFAFFLIPLVTFFILEEKISLFKKVFLYSVLITSMFFSFLCLSKGAILSIFLASIIVIIFNFKIFNSKHKKLIFSTLILSIFLLIISFLFVKDIGVIEFTKQYLLSSKPAQNRIAIYSNTLKTIKNNSIFGGGPGNFQYLYTKEFINNDMIRKKSLDPKAVLVKRAHNEFLHIAVEFGFLGLVFIIFLWVILIKSLFKLRCYLLLYI